MDQTRRSKSSLITWIVVVVTVGAVVAGLVWLGGGKKNAAGAVKDVTAADHVQGPTTASVTLIEYSDFQCPACGSYYTLLKQLQQQAGQKLRFVYRNFPLTKIHPNAQAAAWAAEAAGKQGKFWEMHDRLFETQDTWADLSSVDQAFQGYAKDLGLDVERFKTDVSASNVRSKVADDVASGNAAGVNGTPTFFLNGKGINNPRSVTEFAKLIDDAAKGAVSQSATAEKVHYHFDFRTVVDGAAVDFSQAKYQSSKEHELNEDIHFHDGNGQIVHVHAANVTFGQLLTSFGMSLSADCLRLDSGDDKCATGDKKIRLFVNGVQNSQYADYQPQDLDRILLTYGSESVAQLRPQIDAVSDQACIYSQKCPERGQPPAEADCVGGLGTDCD